MLEIGDKEHFEAVKKFAKDTGQWEQLKEKLDYLDHYAERGERELTRCVLGNDFAPYSFSFHMMRRQPDGTYFTMEFETGLIYHGPHDNAGDGTGPTFSVCLNPTKGWAIHT